MCMCLRVSMCVRVCLLVSMGLCFSVSMSVRLCVHACVHVCMSVCVCWPLEQLWGGSPDGRLFSTESDSEKLQDTVCGVVRKT